MFGSRQNRIRLTPAQKVERPLNVLPVKNGDVLAAIKAAPQIIDTPHDNCEGVCFTREGIVITSEKGRIYRMRESVSN